MSPKKDKKKSNKEINIEFELFEHEPDESILIDGESDIKIANLAFSNIDFSKYNGLAKREFSEVQNQYFKKPKLLPKNGFPTAFDIEDVKHFKSQRGFVCEYMANEIVREKDGFVLTDYNHMRLFISFLSNVLGEIKINFSLSIKKVLCLEADEREIEWNGEKWKSPTVNENDINNLANFMTYNYDNFFNNAEEFKKNFNEILDKNLIEIKEYDIDYEKLDDTAICPRSCYQFKLTIQLND